MRALISVNKMGPQETQEAKASVGMVLARRSSH